jgi:hypothetical protein
VVRFQHSHPARGHAFANVGTQRTTSFEYSLLFEPNARYVRLVTARIGGAIPPKPPADDQVPTQRALLKAFASESR